MALAITLQSLSVITADTLNGNDSFVVWESPFDHLMKAMDSLQSPSKKKKNTYTKKQINTLKFAHIPDTIKCLKVHSWLR